MLGSLSLLFCVQGTLSIITNQTWLSFQSSSYSCKPSWLCYIFPLFCQFLSTPFNSVLIPIVSTVCYAEKHQFLMKKLYAVVYFLYEIVKITKNLVHTIHLA